MRITFLFTLTLAMLLSCASGNDYTTEGAMAGPETRVRFEAFEEMCAREPESVLCNEEGDDND